MTNPDSMKELLLKYIAGEADEKESKIVEEWLQQDPANFKEFEQLWDLWYAVGTATNVCGFNVDSGWEAVLNRVQHRRQRRHNRGFFRMVLLTGSGIAATLLLTIGISLWEHYQKDVSPAPSRISETMPRTPVQEQESASTAHEYDIAVQTRPRQRKKVTLPDGSVVWLNGNTSIRFRERTGSDLRVLRLQGEAFFDVKQAAGKPFIVKTGHAVVKVLGTRFNIMAYPDDTVTEAVLTRGSILFSTETEDKKVSKHIEPGQKVSINHLSEQLKIIKVDTSFYACWKEGKLLFRDETFGEVAKAMEYKYDVSFDFRDKSLLGKRLSGYLEKESLQQALEALQLTLRFRYEIHDREVIIEGRE
jgi:ferric-dicitrate binding protein FerR (iron transport regulator)